MLVLLGFAAIAIYLLTQAFEALVKEVSLPPEQPASPRVTFVTDFDPDNPVACQHYVRSREQLHAIPDGHTACLITPQEQGAALSSDVILPRFDLNEGVEIDLEHLFPPVDPALRDEFEQTRMEKLEQLRRRIDAQSKIIPDTNAPDSNATSGQKEKN